MEFNVKFLAIVVVMFLALDSYSCTEPVRNISMGDPFCEEEAMLLRTQQQRYEEFRDLQQAVLSRLTTIETKTELSLTPANAETNCTTSDSAMILSEIASLKLRLQTFGRNVESITPAPTSCAAIHANRRRFGLELVSGVYAIYVRGNLLRAYCDLVTAGGGWTVFQRRVDADTDFFRTWEEYKRGFGDPRVNYWLGNEFVHLMTADTDEQELRVDLTDWNAERHHVTYRGFSVGDEISRYKLAVGDLLSGNMTDALHQIHNGKSFSAKDNFVNYGACIDCPAFCKGGWWYGCCYYANLNGELRPPGDKDHQTVRWYDKNLGSYIHAKQTELKFRPRDFNGNT